MKYYNGKRVYLVKTNGTKEFWTVDHGAKIWRFIYNDESVDAENCDAVEDDSSWDSIEMSEDEFECLFDDVEIIDEREFK